MAEIVTIRPKEGSKKFNAIQGTMTQFQKITEAGQDFNKPAGEYKSERFPNSKQLERPMWSQTKRRWMLKGYEKGSITPKQQEELNKLVAGCKFKYPDNDPRARQYIMEADIFDLADPFFNHKSLKILLSEGQGTLDKGRAFDQIMLMGMQANNNFQETGAEINPMLSSRVRSVITDRNVDMSVKAKKRDLKLEAFRLYEKLNDAKKVKIAMSMGLISNEKVDRSIIDEVLFAALEDDKTKIDAKTTRQQLFISMCKAPTEEINTRHMIQKAKASGALKKNKTQGYILFGNAIGNTDKQVYEFFKNPANQDIIIRLENKLEKDD